MSENNPAAASGKPDPNAWKAQLVGKSEKVQTALINHHKGYNCAQSVACAFAEELGKSEKEVFEIMEGFVFGMGHMGTCGAVSAIAAVAGMIESDGNLEKPASKKTTYKVSKDLIKEFEDKNSSIICSEIKGIIDGKKTGKILRSCDGCVEDATAIIEKYLQSKAKTL